MRMYAPQVAQDEEVDNASLMNKLTGLLACAVDGRLDNGLLFSSGVQLRLCARRAQACLQERWLGHCGKRLKDQRRRCSHGAYTLFLHSIIGWMDKSLRLLALPPSASTHAKKVVMSEDAAKERGVRPIARILGFGDAAHEPVRPYFVLPPTFSLEFPSGHLEL